MEPMATGQKTTRPAKSVLSQPLKMSSGCMMDAWVSRHFRGRTMRRGQSRKGGKGRGRSGYRQLRSRKGSPKGKYRPKGRSKGRAHVAETDDAYAVKGKCKG